jgi:hypothetical protein
LGVLETHCKAQKAGGDTSDTVIGAFDHAL